MHNPFIYTASNDLALRIDHISYITIAEPRQIALYFAGNSREFQLSFPTPERCLEEFDKITKAMSSINNSNNNNNPSTNNPQQ